MKVYPRPKTCLLLLLYSLAAAMVPVAATAQGPVTVAIRKLAADPDLKAAGLGISVVDAASGREIAGYNAGLALIPASTLKTLSTASALGILGGDFRIKTDLQYDGEIDAKGVLHGNLYLKGYGDPTLGSPEMEGTPGLSALMVRLSMAVQQKGIRRIEGQIVGDGSYFDLPAEADTWQWNDMGNYYAAGAWGLNVHENLYYLRFQKRPKLGDRPPLVEITPAVDGLKMINEVTSAETGTGDNVYIFGAPRTYDRIARGTIPRGSGRFSVKGALPDPPLFAARQLAEQLKSVGIISRKGPASWLEVADTGRERTTLYTHESPPLREIVGRTNTKSINLYAESLLRIVGKARADDGSLAGSLEAVRGFWREKGVSFDAAFIEDGSGLSPRNAVSADFFTGLLHAVAADDRIFTDFYPSLPVSGQSGTLRYTLPGTPAAGKIRAKTGTMERVRSLAGYVETRSGKRTAFCILVNNYSCTGTEMRKKLEPVLMAIFDN
ncbi:MAG: D-alanyl-D-alanine carboxypeptidase/D-alanyl-D-alanine-endopeptidase [Lewinella sp.]|nr:D-alanyl-D-alanine carboxypeptidase/D-alanyl-D-alanine-endopeptidase [Lewinella sp.]